MAGAADKYARDPAYGKPPAWGKLYDSYFPYFTDPWSRHAKVISEDLREPKSPIRRLLVDAGYEPDHWATALEVSVEQLWKARARTRQEACADAKRPLFDAILLRVPQRSRAKLLEKLNDAWAEVFDA